MSVNTGAYLRIKRNFKWENVLVEDLTEDEMSRQFQGRDSNELIRWMFLLAETLKLSEEHRMDLQQRMSSKNDAKMPYECERETLEQAMSALKNKGE